MTELQTQVNEAIRVVESEATTRSQRNGSGRATWYPYPMERDIIILWGMYRGWRNPVIANKLGLSSVTVLKRRGEFGRNPSLIFNLPVLHRGYKWHKPYHRCEFCGEMMVGVEEIDARLHVARHIATEESISLAGVGV